MISVEHKNGEIDIVKFSKAKFLCHLGKIMDYYDDTAEFSEAPEEYRQRCFFQSVSYLEKELWLFDMNKEYAQTNFFCITGHDMAYQQQKQSLIKPKNGRTLFKIEDTYIIDINDCALFNKP
jgi:hypothetical protein